uniref:Peptidase S74 domain-containing protein n=1 Tax=viral metagenome TaxID=1070528 RepID=A0A6C0FAB8_9ZZZZ|tara:strand:+ start:16935 stop:18284 length:1350 start_codon:yes stop_codon:yes gene_type:complete
MSIDGSFNITTEGQDLLFEKDNIESFRIVETGGLQISDKLYLNDLNTYINSEGGSSGFDFVINNNLVMQSSLYGDVSIGTGVRNGALHIHDPTNASIGFSSPTQPEFEDSIMKDTKGFSISMNAYDLIFDNDDFSYYSFGVNRQGRYNNHMCFHPRMYNGDTVIPQMGIGDWNPYSNTAQIYVGGGWDRSMRIGNYDIKNFNSGTRDSNITQGGHLYPGNTWVGLTNYWTNHLHSVGTMACNSAAVYSDERIKRDIQPLEKSYALEKIRSIQPCYFNYIDSLMKGFNKEIGFIAQEVGKVLPETSYVRHEYIPNIYKPGKCVLESNNEYLLTIEYFDTKDLLIDASNNYLPLAIYDDNLENILEISIREVISSNQLRIHSEQTLTEDVFVQGQEVPDFRVLQYEHVFTYATAALQEVDQLLQKQKMKNELLQKKLKMLQERAKNLLEKQ